MININTGFIKISVIGGSRVEAGSKIYEMACQVGRNIAKKGAVLVCGGLTGVMEASCKGAKEEGGLTIGILPTTDASTANKWVDIKMPTGLGFARNALVVLSADAVIAVDGAEGTLSEIGFALTFKKPLIGLNTWEIKPYKKLDTSSIVTASTPGEAVDMAIDSIGRKAP
ncbi:MAG: TIGR00725 family protein [Actinomycetota bacterium]